MDSWVQRLTGIIEMRVASYTLPQKRTLERIATILFLTEIRVTRRKLVVNTPAEKIMLDKCCMD